MTMFGKKCPTPDKLQALAAGEDVSDRVAAHVAQCQTCAKIVDEIRNDAELIAELRSAGASDMDAATRNRILQICRGAAGEASGCDHGASSSNGGC